MDEIDDLIRRHLAQTRPAPTGRVPADEEYLDFAEGRLKGDRLDSFLAHLASHPEDRERAAAVKKALSALHGQESALGAPRAAVQKAKSLRADAKAPAVDCPHCKKSIRFRTPFGKQRLRNALWFLLAALSFGASFYLKHYFLQCLAAAILFGFKGIVDSKATRTQILVYKTLSAAAKDAESGDLQNTPTHL